MFGNTKELKAKIEELENKLKEYEGDEKYNKVVKENTELKSQLLSKEGEISLLITKNANKIKEIDEANKHAETLHEIDKLELKEQIKQKDKKIQQMKEDFEKQKEDIKEKAKVESAIETKEFLLKHSGDMSELLKEVVKNGSTGNTKIEIIK